MAALGTLSKCRLCLKLGEFYSIFAADNSVQLARMAMACSNVQIHEGDGLPDRVCGECVEKLSAAYIFKQQCERSDAELRKAMLLSNPNLNVQLAELSAGRKRKSPDYDDSKEGEGYSGDLLRERYSVNVPNTDNIATKRPRLSEQQQQQQPTPSSSSEGTLECDVCEKKFATSRGLGTHRRMHRNDEDNLLERPILIKTEPADEDYYFEGRAPKVEPPESHGPSAYDIERTLKKCACPICSSKYKKRTYLQKHLNRSACGIALQKHVGKLKGDCPSAPVPHQISVQNVIDEVDNIAAGNVLCSNCGKRFQSHQVMMMHFYQCLNVLGAVKIACMTCKMTFATKKTLARHVKSFHNKAPAPEAVVVKMEKPKATTAPFSSLQCHKCNKSFEDQTKLVMHLAAHMTNVDVKATKIVNDESEASLKCPHCPQKFRNKWNLANHARVHQRPSVVVVSQLIAPAFVEKPHKCHACGKTFQFAKSLAIHASIKHRSADGESAIAEILPADFAHARPPRAGFAALPVRCLLCDVTIAGRKEAKRHNLEHMRKKEKPLNEYTCVCGDKFTSTKVFYLHYREHDFGPRGEIKVENGDGGDDDEPVYDASISNFCEITTDGQHDSDEEANRGHDEGSDGEGAKDDSGTSSCFVCHKKFRNESAYRKHMKLHYHDTHIDPALLACKLCRKKSKNMRAYIAHMSWHVTQGRYKCHRCGEAFAYRKVYANHLLGAHGVDVTEAGEATGFGCGLCKRHYTTRESLAYHEECHERGEQFLEVESHACTLCAKKFPTKYYLTEHMQANHDVTLREEASVEVEYLNYQSARSGRVSKQMVLCGKYRCDKCDEKFESQAGLTKHQRRHHASPKLVETHACAICNKTFHSRGLLDIHARIHDRNDRNSVYRCRLCSKVSSSIKIHLLHLSKAHLMIEEKDSPLVCQHCQSVFPRRHELRIHLRVEHGVRENYVEVIPKDDRNFQNSSNTSLSPGCDPFEKKLKCRVCSKSFSMLVKLNCHLKTQHNIDTTDAPFAFKASVCDFCFSVFNSEERMAAHKKSHYANAGMQCKLCDKGVQPTHYKKHKNFHYADTYADNPVKCEECPETFVRLRDLLSHCSSVHGEPFAWYKPRSYLTEECNVCHKQFPNVQRHLLYHDKYRCKKCREYFYSEILFKDHICQVESEPEAETSEPPSRSSAIRAKPVKEDVYEECEFCMKPFVGQSNQGKHNYNHYSVRIKCRLCSKKFTMKPAFIQHAKSHLKQQFADDPLQCRHCAETFDYYQAYQRHMKKVHDDSETMEFSYNTKTEECLICKKSFSCIDKHYKYHKELQCKACSKYILSHRSFSLHKCDNTEEDPSEVVQYDEDISHLLEPPEEACEIRRSTSKRVKNDEESFDQFSPVISATMSLSSTNNAEDKDIEENGDTGSLEIKNEPIDDYYKNYSHCEFQGSLLDTNQSG